MSIRKWAELAKSKAAASAQSEAILNAFKTKKIQDELETGSYEKLLKPVTKKLDVLKTPQEEEDEDEGEAYEERSDFQLPEYEVEGEAERSINLTVVKTHVWEIN